MCTVRSNHNVATFIKELVLELPEGESVPFRAGGYIQIEAPAPHGPTTQDFDVERGVPGRLGQVRHVAVHESKVDEARHARLLDGELSGREGIIMLNVRPSPDRRPPAAPPSMDVPPGQMSSFIFGLKPGDKVDDRGSVRRILRQGNGEGDGVRGRRSGNGAHAVAHSSTSSGESTTDRKITFWYGARSLARGVLSVDDFDKIQEGERQLRPGIIALSDVLDEDDWENPDSEGRQTLGGKAGFTGFIHQVLLRRSTCRSTSRPRTCEYYLCGPPIMNQSVINMLLDLGVEPENIALDDFGG